LTAREHDRSTAITGTAELRKEVAPNDAGMQANGDEKLSNDPDGNAADSVAVDQDISNNIDVPSKWTWDKCVLAILLGTGITSGLTLLVAVIGVVVSMMMRPSKKAGAEGDVPLVDEEPGEEAQAEDEGEEVNTTAPETHDF
jgi:hypothetical protein